MLLYFGALITVLTLSAYNNEMSSQRTFYYYLMNSFPTEIKHISILFYIFYSLTFSAGRIYLEFYCFKFRYWDNSFSSFAAFITIGSNPKGRPSPLSPERVHYKPNSETITTTFPTHHLYLHDALTVLLRTHRTSSYQACTSSVPFPCNGTSGFPRNNLTLPPTDGGTT